MEISENNDLCSLALNKNPNFTCGFLGFNCICMNADRCAYKLSEQYFKPYDKNEKSTIEKIIALEQKNNRRLTYSELNAIVPQNEIVDNFVVDSKGNIYNLKTHRIIYRNYKK